MSRTMAAALMFIAWSISNSFARRHSEKVTTEAAPPPFWEPSPPAEVSLFGRTPEEMEERTEPAGVWWSYLTRPWEVFKYYWSEPQ